MQTSTNKCLLSSCLFTLLVLLFSENASGQVREWANNKGLTITAEFEGYDSSSDKVKLRIGEKEYLYPLSDLSSADQNWVKKQDSKKKGSAKKLQEDTSQEEIKQEAGNQQAEKRQPLNRREDFTVEINQTKSIHVIYHDTGSDVVIVLVPGANQDQALGENYNGFTPQFIQAGYSTATVYTDFGPMINHGRMKNNRYFHKLFPALVERYGEKDFVLFGGSNGGMTIMQAVEDNRSKSNILALIANPTVYVPRRGINGMPVYLRIGEEDFLDWDRHYEKVKNGLAERGAKLNAKLLPGEPHIPFLNHVEVLEWFKEHSIKPFYETEE